MSQDMYDRDNVHWYMSELTSRIVAESGRPSDRHHLGKIIMQGLKDDPEFILQIDGDTGRTETSGSVLRRSIQCATCLMNLGLKRGDVMILMAPTHLDLAIPFYAAFYLGVVAAPIDKDLGVYELQNTFEVDKPKIIFSQSDKRGDIQQALDNIKLDATIVTFDEGPGSLSFSRMMEQFGSNAHEFKPAEFDPSETLAMLVTTSGSTGLPKAAAHTQKGIAMMSMYLWATFKEFPKPFETALTMAPLQWLSSILKFVTSPVVRFTRLHSASQLTPDRIYEMINKYKPSLMITSPTLLTNLLKPGEREKCDFTCFKVIMVGGSRVHPPLFTEIKKAAPETEIADAYGLSEIATVGFQMVYGRPGCCGVRYGGFDYRLVNTDTREIILEPNDPGELWLKGPALFKGYYNNPEATAETVTKDGWFKTGDIMYRDENWNYYFVERLKLLLKYKSYQISPVEVESVILQHPDVLDVAVTGIPHEEFGDLPVACVVRRPGSGLSATDIKDLVKHQLADSKQLRGGIVFLKELPLTPSTKIHRRKLKDMVLSLERE